MNNVLILLDNPDDWKPYCETKSILTVSDYLKNKPVEKDRKLVINLSNDYSYNSEGYYCSLLAQTRGQKVIPDVDIINKMEAGTGVRMDRSLQALCYQWIQKNDIKDDIWYLNIYFGKCREKRSWVCGTRLRFQRFCSPSGTCWPSARRGQKWCR